MIGPKLNVTDDTPILELPLSVRTLNALRHGPVVHEKYWLSKINETFGDVKGLKDHELLVVPNFGRKSLKEWTDFRNAVLGVEPETAQKNELDRLFIAHENAVIALRKIQRDLRKALLESGKIQI